MSSNDIEFLRAQVKDSEYKLMRLAGEYEVLHQKKYELVQEYCERKEALFIAENKNIKTIAHEVIEYLNSIDILHTFGSVYERIDNKYKQDNIKQLLNLYGSPKGEYESLNTPEERILEKAKALQDEIDQLPEGRKNKVENQIKELKKELPEEVTSEDFGIHQNEPPENMQGPSEFSEAVRMTANWFLAASKHYNKIADEIETYKPTTPERIAEKAKDWNETINGTIIVKILNPIFMTETAAEADRKYSTSKMHWIGIIKNRIEQSKHGAGKMAENFITDPFGRPIYNKKGKPIKKSISRERVGDFEWPIVDEAEALIKANAGLFQLHDWLENDQGGHRRLRKELLHDYFAEASMGSIKSGNPEYEQFMREYKKKQMEKFSDANS